MTPRATRENAKRWDVALVRLGRRVLVDADEWDEMVRRRASKARRVLTHDDRAELAAWGLVPGGDR